jgi:hypothetical protein
MAVSSASPTPRRRAEARVKTGPIWQPMGRIVPAA